MHLKDHCGIWIIEICGFFINDSYFVGLSFTLEVDGFQGVFSVKLYVHCCCY